MTLIYGHRGAKGEAPENTLASFQRCLEHGVNRCELDLHLSRDGELMVIHDPTLKRTTGRRGKVTEAYPANPNRSPRGITGLSSRDGRVTIMMPHPERVFRAVQNSWRPDDWQEDGGWLRMFRNARVWVD